MRRSLLLSFLAMFAVLPVGPVRAEETIPLLTGDLSVQDKAARLEVEIVSIGQFGAVPNTLHRHAGKFILIVRNVSGDPNPSFVLESLIGGGTQQTVTPVLRLDSIVAWHGYWAGLVDAPVGQLRVSSPTTGKVLCQITID
jgi:hypothetical protein